MTEARSNEIASYADHAFEAAQRALAAGSIENFRYFAAQHQGLADLHRHLARGGSIH